MHHVVLCIDEDPEIAAMRSLLLSIAGYRATSASTEAVTLQLLRSDPVELIIISPLHSRSNGHLLSKMKQIKPGVPILLFTDLRDLPQEWELADGVLVKGLAAPDFLAQIAEQFTVTPVGLMRVNS